MRHLGWLILCLPLLHFAGAQPSWAVQVVALRDLREARSAADALADLGFPSYLEFAMNGGRQFVRVRVGCYGTREAAVAMAEALRGSITADAQATELSQGADVQGCVEESVGFLNGYGWDLEHQGGVPVFSVTVAGVPARVTHDGERWRMVQEGEAVPAMGDQVASWSVSGKRISGRSFAVLDGPAPTVLCPGEVITAVAGVAIVERGDVVVACRWTPRSPS